MGPFAIFVQVNGFVQTVATWGQQQQEKEKELEGGYSSRNQGAVLVVENGMVLVFVVRGVLVEAVVVRKNQIQQHPTGCCGGFSFPVQVVVVVVVACVSRHNTQLSVYQLSAIRSLWD